MTETLRDYRDCMSFALPEDISNESPSNIRENNWGQGWECPRCRIINAPWKSNCDCPVPTEVKTTNTNSAYYY